MGNLFQNEDGACAAAKAVRAYLAAKCDLDGLAWFDQPNIDRWHNCREQGYVVSISLAGKRRCIAFFEHRNSDEICAVEWDDFRKPNPPMFDDIPASHLYRRDKYAVTYREPAGGAADMADWIYERLTDFALVHKVAA